MSAHYVPVMLRLAFTFLAVLPALPLHAQDDQRPAECVVLLHGLARTEFSFASLQDILEDEGYATVNTGYPSTEKRSLNWSTTRCRGMSLLVGMRPCIS